MPAFCVGLTGGVASGKTTVSDAFGECRATVVDADVIAREVVSTGSEGLSALVAAFGASILDEKGELDRRRMRERVFADDDARRAIEAIVHPRVRARMLDLCRVVSGPYCIAAIPLLSEGGGRAAYPWLDRIAVVDVEPQMQISRLIARDGVDTLLAQRIVNAQATRAQRLALADDVLVNATTIAVLRSGVAALDRRYRALAGARSGFGA